MAWNGKRFNRTIDNICYYICWCVSNVIFGSPDEVIKQVKDHADALEEKLLDIPELIRYLKANSTDSYPNGNVWIWKKFDENLRRTGNVHIPDWKRSTR